MLFSSYTSFSQLLQEGIRTAGMLLRDGVSKGLEPTVQVLEVAANGRRQPSDILPYLPDFSKHFAPLPKKLEDLHLRAVFIPLADIECITRTTIKVVAPLKNLSERRGM